MNKTELESKHLAELHTLAADAGVPGYRMLRREELIEKLSNGDGAPAKSESEKPRGERPPRRERAPRDRPPRDRPPRQRRERPARKEPAADAPAAEPAAAPPQAPAEPA